MKIKEVIVVEGKNDTMNLSRTLDVVTIETHGTHLSKKTIEMIRNAQKTCGVIIFTDPDFPGTQIRTKINEAIPGCKNAFLNVNKARGKSKVGIEHALSKDIEEALKNCVTYNEKTESISWSEFTQLGLSGKENSSELRKIILDAYYLGEANAKTSFKRLNMLQITKKELEELMRRVYE